jgi:hypothetical protein
MFEKGEEEGGFIVDLEELILGLALIVVGVDRDMVCKG